MIASIRLGVCSQHLPVRFRVLSNGGFLVHRSHYGAKVNKSWRVKELIPRSIPDPPYVEEKHVRGLPKVAPLVRVTIGDGSSFVASDLAEYLSDKGTDHLRAAPHDPQTQGKIEPSRQITLQSLAGNGWHQTMKNRVLLENYFIPGDLERQSAHSSTITTPFDTTRA